MVGDSKRVYVESFGCSANVADGEVIAGCLSEAGFEVVGCPRDAEILVCNTCAVKSPTENRVMDVLRKAPRDKRLVVTGCLPLINFERLKSEVEFGGVTGPAPGDRIVEVVRRVAAGEKVVFLGGVSQPSLRLPRIQVNPVVSIVPINYGCLGDCSYCCVRFARGRLRSYSVDEVVERVRHDLVSGAKEVWLTSQDAACYGKDIGASLPELLSRVCEVEGDFFVRVGMMNPDHVLGMLDELVGAYKCGKVFKFLHLPVQSGDDEVLGLMNRRYTVEDFRMVVQTFRKEVPRLTLATDVICGFPGESGEAFERTKRLLEEVQPDVVNVSKFFSRPGTSAERMVALSPHEVKRRSREAAALSRRISFERNRAWMGWEGTVLFDERGKGMSWVGRNFAYKPVVVKGGESLVGRFVPVRVVNAFSTYLEAEML
ncbi:MAG TPA: tRNA (N(6)-L-threonylcarbamoyladenosine(37)-C(2))-methylthiotransferase [Candidatus Bathyarchaeota archaeon]|nr:tRNA (N(6)-L-threonylcarbamoyladenosine(37)-C(2))-methylthiotransferase [Candidatus Bathyarchaeota archaeon]